ncbi:hypothetical protein BH09ACT1_BH09ACT1_08300 [soil metagenome]
MILQAIDDSAVREAEDILVRVIFDEIIQSLSATTARRVATTPRMIAAGRPTA